jgi:hypothetical protein
MNRTFDFLVNQAVPNLPWAPPGGNLAIIHPYHNIHQTL